MKSAIYAIRNIFNQKVYVGSAINYEDRWRRHEYSLRDGKHHSRHLQRSWNKYGKDNFVFEILEIVPEKEKLLETEQKWIDHHKSFDREFGYNISPTAGSSLGVKHSKEMRERVSRAVKGRKLSDEAKKNISKSKMGEKNPMFRYKYTKEQRKAMSERNSGKGNPFYGKKHSEEARLKMSKNGKGKNKGRKLSKEHVVAATAASKKAKRELSSMSQSTVDEIRSLREQGKKLVEIAKMFDLKPSYVGKICRYEIWK